MHGAKEITLPCRALFPPVHSKYNTSGPVFHFEDLSVRQRDTHILSEDHALSSIPCTGDYRSSLLVPIPRHYLSGRLSTFLAR